MTYTIDVSGFHPQQMGWQRSVAHHQLAFIQSGRSLLAMEETGGNMYQEYIFLQKWEAYCVDYYTQGT